MTMPRDPGRLVDHLPLHHAAGKNDVVVPVRDWGHMLVRPGVNRVPGNVVVERWERLLTRHIARTHPTWCILASRSWKVIDWLSLDVRLYLRLTLVIAPVAEHELLRGAWVARHAPCSGSEGRTRG